VNGQLATNQGVFTGFWGQKFNLTKNPARYVAQIQRSSISENSISSEWCHSMLRNGITATLGLVAEPYLHTFPELKVFFMEFYQGSCLVKAYYQTKPFNSWQLLLIGDPLYIKTSPLK